MSFLALSALVLSVLAAAGAAAGVGVGWDLTLFAFGMHLAGQAVDPTGLEQTPEYRRFVVLSSTAWGAALEASGMATAAAAVAERTAAFYAPGVDQGA